MVFINEWLPNPVGADAAGEFVELYNSGPGAVDLYGWTIKSPKGRSARFGEITVPADGYAVFESGDLKFALVNTNGGLALYYPSGALADEAAFYGAAPEGKSFSRADRYGGPASHFAWAEPTPGAENLTEEAVIATSSAPYGALGPGQFTAADFFAIMMGTAAVITIAIFYVIKRHEDLSKLFSARNGEAGRSAGKTRGVFSGTVRGRNKKEDEDWTKEDAIPRWR